MDRVNIPDEAPGRATYYMGFAPEEYGTRLYEMEYYGDAVVRNALMDIGSQRTQPYQAISSSTEYEDLVWKSKGRTIYSCLFEVTYKDIDVTVELDFETKRLTLQVDPAINQKQRLQLAEFLHPFWANSGTQAEDGQSDYADQFHIEQYVSDHDEDGDGVNDQTDMLQSTRNYIATKPKYKSNYYSSGYPDDGYGVCTDVVAFACKVSGYDLMQLVADDVQAAQDDYGIETPDANIDFRRVGNLNTYFSRHAQSLTTDLGNIEEWQGGDIVVFSSHIAIVSDKRNKKGIPYIIHHVSSTQKAYEEDKMQRWEKKAGIIGHYRIGEAQ